jgi:hypothetical protein
MKLSDLEDSDQVVTKDYLDAKLERLKSDLLQQLIASELRPIAHISETGKELG